VIDKAKERQAQCTEDNSVVRAEGGGGERQIRACDVIERQA